jgi:hypothetical protein
MMTYTKKDDRPDLSRGSPSQVSAVLASLDSFPENPFAHAAFSFDASIWTHYTFAIPGSKLRRNLLIGLRFPAPHPVGGLSLRAQNGSGFGGLFTQIENLGEDPHRGPTLSGSSTERNIIVSARIAW